MKTLHRLSHFAIGLLLSIVVLVGCNDQPAPPVTDEPPSTPTTKPAPTALPVSTPALTMTAESLPLSIICRLPDGSSLSDEPHFTVFKDGKQVSAGQGYKGTYLIDLPPGQYDLLVKYGKPKMYYLVTDVDVTPDKSTHPVLLPYSQVNILVQTESGPPSARSYESLALIPNDYPAPFGEPWSLGDDKANPVTLEILEGRYIVTLAWQTPDGESETLEREFEVMAGEPLSVTLDAMLDDGWLRVETTSSSNQYYAGVQLTDSNGELVAQSLNVSNYSSFALWPAYVGNYTVTVRYSNPLTTVHSVGVAVQSGATTIVKVSDVITSTPKVQVVAP